MTNNEQGKRRWRMSRRKFLIGMGATGGALAIGVAVGLPYGRLKLAEMIDSGGGGFFSMPNDPWAWFEVAQDGRITLFISKVEMGQGVHTAIKQIAIDELGLSWDAISVAQGTTTVGPQDSSGTSGSTSISSSFTPVREAAATLVQMLRQEAALQTRRSTDSLRIQDDGFAGDEGGTIITFGEIVTNKTGEWEVPEEPAPLKPIGNLKLVGQPQPRVDIPAKVTGKAVYGYDANLPGMKFGAVLRPPTLEARLKTVDTVNAKTMPGVVAVVEDGDFVGVVADSRPQAWAALDAIEAEWDEGKLWQQAELEEIVTVGGRGGVDVQKVGDVDDVFDNAKVITADYRTPLAVQSPLEAQAALADVGPEKARVWASTQVHTSLQGQVADVIGLDAAAVEIIPTYLGGGFGRKLGDVAVEAARLSKGAAVPVHLGWTRPEELTAGFMQPLSHHRLNGVVDGDGRITAIEHQIGSGDILFSFFPEAMAAVFGADIGVTRGAHLFYNAPNRRVTVWRRKLPVKTGSWRGLGLLPNTFAIESFIDELAHSIGMDPLQFRLNNLGDDERSRRYAAVLEVAANTAKWGSAPEGRALGLAGIMDMNTAVAALAEVSVNEEGKIRVHKISSAMDCGLVINPDGAKAQMEGNAMWGVSAALKEEATVKDGRIALNNFETYPLLTMREAPKVAAVLVDSGQTVPYGVGEPPIAPIAAAIGNAMFALTGKRLRQMPFTPARVREAEVVG
jgi:isoquinoline 1-oxidoreductase beta subunit